MGVAGRGLPSHARQPNPDPLFYLEIFAAGFVFWDRRSYFHDNAGFIYAAIDMAGWR